MSHWRPGFSPSRGSPSGHSFQVESARWGSTWPYVGARVVARSRGYEDSGKILELRETDNRLWFGCEFGDRLLYFVTVEDEKEASAGLFNGPEGRACTYVRVVRDMWSHGTVEHTRFDRRGSTILRDYFVIADAASFLRVPEATLRDWHREGKIRARGDPIDRTLLFKKTDLERLLQNKAAVVDLMDAVQRRTVQRQQEGKAPEAWIPGDGIEAEEREPQKVQGDSQRREQNRRTEAEIKERVLKLAVRRLTCDEIANGLRPMVCPTKDAPQQLQSFTALRAAVREVYASLRIPPRNYPNYEWWRKRQLRRLRSR